MSADRETADAEARARLAATFDAGGGVLLKQRLTPDQVEHVREIVREELAAAGVAKGVSV